MADDPLDDIDAAAEDLLRLYEMAGIPALILTYTGKHITVRCQDQEDVLPMCNAVVKQYDRPSGQKVN